MELTQREDIIKFIIKIQLNFENAYVTTTQLERELLVESWYEALGNLPKAVCTAAVNNVLKRAKFAPRLGDITEEAEKLLAPEAKSDEQLWAELNSVLAKTYDISRYLTYPQYFKWATQKLDEIYAGLSDELKLFVVNRSALIELAEMSTEGLAFERTRFFKQMPILKRHKKDTQAAQKLLAETQAKQLALENKKNSD